MDFAYFLLGMVSNLMHIIYDVLIYVCVYVVPTINYFLPIFFDNLCWLTTMLLRIFFKYVNPCLVMAFDLFAAAVSKIIAAFGWLCLSIIELDVAIIDQRVVLFLLCGITLYYYNNYRYVREAVIFVRDGGRLVALNAVYFVRSAEMCTHFIVFLYKCVKQTVIRLPT